VPRGRVKGMSRLGTVLVGRFHIDLKRVSSAICPR
jgi:hypothetical protein